MVFFIGNCFFFEKGRRKGSTQLYCCLAQITANQFEILIISCSLKDI